MSHCHLFIGVTGGWDYLVASFFWKQHGALGVMNVSPLEKAFGSYTALVF